MFFGYWVKAAIMPRVTFSNAFCTECKAFEKAVLFHSIVRILRTSWIKTAISA